MDIEIVNDYQEYGDQKMFLVTIPTDTNAAKLENGSHSIYGMPVTICHAHKFKDGVWQLNLGHCKYGDNKAAYDAIIEQTWRWKDWQVTRELYYRQDELQGKLWETGDFITLC
jgi:hypothetical protein